jgi:hypothetical protein
MGGLAASLVVEGFTEEGFDADSVRTASQALAARRPVTFAC